MRTEAFIPGLGLNPAAPSQKHQVTPQNGLRSDDEGHLFFSVFQLIK